MSTNALNITSKAKFHTVVRETLLVSPQIFCPATSTVKAFYVIYIVPSPAASFREEVRPQLFPKPHKTVIQQPASLLTAFFFWVICTHERSAQSEVEMKWTVKMRGEKK